MTTGNPVFKYEAVFIALSLASLVDLVMLKLLLHFAFRTLLACKRRNCNSIAKCSPELLHHWSGDGGDALPDGGAAGEGDHPDVPVLHDGLASAGSQPANQIHHAGREP